MVQKNDCSRDFVVKVSGADGHGGKVDVYKTLCTNTLRTLSVMETLHHVALLIQHVVPLLSLSSTWKKSRLILVPPRSVSENAPWFRGFTGRGEFPVVLGRSADQERLVTRIELMALEAGVRAAVQFIPKLAASLLSPINFPRPTRRLHFSSRR